MDATKTLGDYTSLLRRRWRYLATIVPAVLLLAVFLAYSLPVSYRASGTIMLEPSSIPAEMVPTTVTGGAELGQFAQQQLELTRRRVMARENLVEIVQSVDPYPDLQLSKNQKADFISADTSIEAVDPITLEPLLTSSAFSIYYVNEDPKRAAMVADKLLELFVTANRRTRAEQAKEAYQFLTAQSKQLESSMQEMELKLAKFKSKYGDALPQAETRNLAGMERAQRDLENVQREIRLVEERASLLELQVAEVSPSLTAAVGDWRTELAKLRAELALAEQKYTEEHPDVRRLRRAIAELAQLGGASTKAGAAKADNPEYLRLRSQLTAAQRELDALRASATRARSEVMSFEQNLSTAPNVEPEYVQLTRNYENAQRQYQGLQDKIKTAALALDLETEARGERFTLIRPASTPNKPYSPNRLGIILLGIVLGGGLAIGVAVLVDASDPTVRSSEDLVAIMEDTPVGAIPLILNRTDRRQRLRVWGSVAAAFVCVAILVAVRVATSS
jgi:polysaccharide chain length determinant protein (PEP-CTERM system associated)